MYVVNTCTVTPVRQEPSEGSEQLTQLLFGEVCEVLDRLPRWTKIRSTLDGQVGWVDFKMLEHVGDEAMRRLGDEAIRRLGDEVRDIATCVYTGLMTDTGNFSYNSNRPQIYPIIAQLIEVGVDKDAIYNAVFNQYSVDRMKLVGYCLYQKMRVFPCRGIHALVQLLI